MATAKQILKALDDLDKSEFDLAIERVFKLIKILKEFERLEEQCKKSITRPTTHTARSSVSKQSGQP